MGKLTIVLSEKTENDLRKYVAKKYPTEIYGKISFVIEQALLKYFEENPE
ncbi:MAG TPA: hypothetical protein VK536_09845 [Candidatus Limnocylindrales bacterium]|nr:hypothetical protein [Candidatus Limnocylindrales bacterium]